MGSVVRMKTDVERGIPQPHSVSFCDCFALVATSDTGHRPLGMNYWFVRLLQNAVSLLHFQLALEYVPEVP